MSETYRCCGRAGCKYCDGSGWASYTPTDSPTEAERKALRAIRVEWNRNTSNREMDHE